MVEPTSPEARAHTFRGDTDLLLTFYAGFMPPADFFPKSALPQCAQYEAQ